MPAEKPFVVSTRGRPSLPSVQRGRVEKLPSGRWSARYYDEEGKRVRQGGFETKSAARGWLDSRMSEVIALRRGDVVPVSHRPQTVNALLDTFEARHGRCSTRPRSGPTRAR